MDTHNDNAPVKRRNYCAVAEYYEPDGPPTAVVHEDQHGPLIRVSPFGHHGPVLGFTFERWNACQSGVNSAVNEYFASRIAANPL